MRDRIVFPAVDGGWHDKHRETTQIWVGRLCFLESKREAAAVTIFLGKGKNYKWLSDAFSGSFRCKELNIMEAAASRGSSV